MIFIYRTFNIDCFVRLTNGHYVGQATISRVSSSDGKGSSYETGFLPSFATEAKALGYTRNFAEMWCNENFFDMGQVVG